MEAVLSDIPVGFFAYPSSPIAIGRGIEDALTLVKNTTGSESITTWKETDVAGRFIADQLLDRIASANVFLADVTQLNFNVTYEVGFALGKGKRTLLFRNTAYKAPGPSAAELGIFDTLGYIPYENAHQLRDLLVSQDYTPPPARQFKQSLSTPLYLLEARHKTDPVTRIVSRVKKARLFFRSFDPSETPRLSGPEAIRAIGESYGVLLHLLPSNIEDSVVHNLRAAFLAGLAAGMDRLLLFLQDGEEPVPLDYRDLVTPFSFPSHIDDAIAEFAPRVMEAMQATSSLVVVSKQTRLEQVTFGASSAENEFRDLAFYYLETDQFQRALRGEIRLVVGRKGSGKTAIFARVRDRVRQERQNVVLDLKPEGYKLLKFKETVLDLLQVGTQEHTLTAFWEYLLLLEICYKLLEKDRDLHTRDNRLYEPYRRLSNAYHSDEFISEGDFSERLTALLGRITDFFHAEYATASGQRLSDPQITGLLYRHDLAVLKQNVISYLKFKREVWLLFDNLDKGWPTHGLAAQDLVIIRALLDSTRKLERQLQHGDIDCHTLVFLRNDVYQRLVDETPDRGKDSRVTLDWTDADLLRELLRRRMVFSSGAERSTSFDDLWRQICVSHVDGEETAQYLIDRCLMRPRSLIDLVNHCRGFAVNLQHPKIEADDIRKGVLSFSRDVISDIGFEIRDVLPAAENVLHAFLDAPEAIPESELQERLLRAGIAEPQHASVTDLLLWYSVLGVSKGDGSSVYIHSVGYEMPILRSLVKDLRGRGGVVFHVSPAFTPGLEIRP